MRLLLKEKFDIAKDSEKLLSGWDTASKFGVGKPPKEHFKKIQILKFIIGLNRGIHNCRGKE